MLKLDVCHIRSRFTSLSGLSCIFMAATLNALMSFSCVSFPQCGFSMSKLYRYTSLSKCYSDPDCIGSNTEYTTQFWRLYSMAGQFMTLFSIQIAAQGIMIASIAAYSVHSGSLCLPKVRMISMSERLSLASSNCVPCIQDSILVSVENAYNLASSSRFFSSSRLASLVSMCAALINGQCKGTPSCTTCGFLSERLFYISINSLALLTAMLQA